MDRPLSSWGYGLAPFRLRIPTLRNRCFHVGHQRVFGGGIKALPVFVNILTMLYKKFAGLIGGILSTIVLKYMRNRRL